MTNCYPRHQLPVRDDLPRNYIYSEYGNVKLAIDTTSARIGNDRNLPEKQLLRVSHTRV